MIKAINKQTYQCQTCRRVYSEQDIGSVRVDGFFRLYCPMCQSEDVEPVIIKEGVKDETDTRKQKQSALATM